MNDNDIPKRLQRAMQDAGLVNPRSDRPSLSAWKRESGVHTSTISRFVKGGTTLPANVRKMADALGVSVAELHSMTGRTGPAPWSPPQGTEALTARQRAALSELVLAFIEEDKGVDDASQAEDQAGSSENVQGAGDRAPIDLAQARKVKDDPAAFGDQPRQGDLDQGKLQPPPAPEKSAAWRTRNRGKEIREEQDRDE